MPSPLVKTTIQACVMAVVSNLTAQFITAYKTKSDYTINWTPVLQFIIFTALNTPPNFLWQSFLESTFPSHTLVPSTSATTAAVTNNEKALDNSQKAHSALEPKLSIPNTLIKFSLDQSLGAAVNTVLFCLAIAGFKGATFQQAIGSAREEFWPIMSAGWTLWPLVSAVNYTLVRSVEGRSLVGGLAGMGWGVYLSLVTN
ncbi:uncharacterized protein BP5553_00990 [Venustampulla echinocandica]|uniref:Uncharacterized protein n=1 Tax=Venustampulla echinocandica TaxID=2656787 RepID=A0A370TZR0_9HELO|nr:uncharacterized protein BP5553_00990 [Venustampulla echinocandica]RDL41011.1 hypothetical protein BP5553_00990 [Venustampulla echinocandica]